MQLQRYNVFAWDDHSSFLETYEEREDALTKFEELLQKYQVYLLELGSNQLLSNGPTFSLPVNINEEGLSQFLISINPNMSTEDYEIFSIQETFSESILQIIRDEFESIVLNAGQAYVACRIKNNSGWSEEQLGRPLTMMDMFDALPSIVPASFDADVYPYTPSYDYASTFEDAVDLANDYVNAGSPIWSLVKTGCMIHDLATGKLVYEVNYWIQPVDLPDPVYWPVEYPGLVWAFGETEPPFITQFNVSDLSRETVIAGEWIHISVTTSDIDQEAFEVVLNGPASMVSTKKSITLGNGVSEQIISVRFRRSGIFEISFSDANVTLAQQILVQENQRVVYDPDIVNLWPRVTFVVDLIDPNFVNTPAPDTLQNLMHNRETREVHIEGVPVSLQHGDRFVLYGRKAEEVQRLYSSLPRSDIKVIDEEYGYLD